MWNKKIFSNFKVIKSLLYRHHILRVDNGSMTFSIFLLLYWSTPYCSTNESPSSLLMKRNIRNKLPSLQEFLKAKEPQTGTVSFDSKFKANQIRYNKRYSSKVTIKTGDKLLIKQINRNKLSTNFSPEPMKVIQIQGSQVMTTFKWQRGIYKKYVLFQKAA